MAYNVLRSARKRKRKRKKTYLRSEKGGSREVVRWHVQRSALARWWCRGVGVNERGTYVHVRAMS
jgi:hypothetical protein